MICQSSLSKCHLTFGAADSNVGKVRHLKDDAFEWVSSDYHSVYEGGSHSGVW